MAGDLAEEVDDLVERDAAADTDVENFAGDAAGCFKREQVGLHGVLDVSKVAGLFAIAENHGSRFVQCSGAEFREHAGVWGAGILARTKNIEVTQRYVFEAVTST